MTAKIRCLLALLVGVALFSSREAGVEAENNARSCISVYHLHVPTADDEVDDVSHFISTDGIDGDIYTVEYRLRNKSGISWGSWSTPSEAVEASNGSGDYGFRYTTSDTDPSTYDLVEWRVITDGNSGTNSVMSTTMYSVDITQNTYTNLSTSSCAANSTPSSIQWAGFLINYEAE